MSWQATNWALEQQCGSAGRKLILLCLANDCDRNGRCSLSQQALVREAEQSERSVRDHLRILEEMQLIRRRKGERQSDGTYAQDFYELNINPPANSAARPPATVAAGPPADIADGPAANSAGGPAANSAAGGGLSPPNLPPHPPLVPPLLKDKSVSVYAREAEGAAEKGSIHSAEVIEFPIDWQPCETTNAMLRMRGFTTPVPDHWVISFVGHNSQRHMRRGAIPGEFLKWAGHQRAFDRRNGVKQETAHPVSAQPLPPKITHTLCGRFLSKLNRRCTNHALSGDFCESCQRELAQGVGK